MLKKLIFTVAIFSSIWIGGLIDFYGRIPAQASKISEIKKNADAIIVLTGGKNRIEGGLDLLRGGKAEKLFITGVGKDVADLELLKRLDVAAYYTKKISLGHEATDTFGNAIEAKKWIESNQIKSVILVTANYHMPRAYELFRQSIPGVDFVPYATITPDFEREDWLNNKHTRKIILSEYHKFLLSF